MNNKEFVGALASRMDFSNKETQRVIDKLIESMSDIIDEDTNLSIQGFGIFDVKKKMERVIVNPSNKQRMLIPPKLTLSFKPSLTMKDKFK